MRQKITVFTALMCCFQFACAQDSIQQTNIEGIGIFKIGKTDISIIEELKNELNVKVERTNNSSYQYSKELDSKKFILEFYADTVNSYNSPVYSSVLSDVRIFEVRGYSVANIELKDLVLYFYKDTLYELKCDYSQELIDAVKLKYGEGQLESSEREVQCSSRLTGTYSLKEQTFYTTWSNGLIHAVYTLSKYYDSKCEKKLLAYFIVSNSQLVTEIRELEDALKNLRKNADAEAKKKELKDF